MYNLIIKRFFDILISSNVLIFAFPFLVLISVIIFVFGNTKGVFFLQYRPGKNSKLFKMIKFKTMTDQKDANGNLLHDKHRITKIGRFIRATSIDEIPQLINVLKGEMSIVGPRPLLPKYLPLYNKRQSRRHEVRPGITGWSQINGRNALTWKEKLELDIWYVENISFILDLKILFVTIIKVLRKEGINTNNSVSGETFTGKN
tara:strand:+ start:258 stop:866 length:609 start_codon:yes stop_codon:yes gene_type:complete